jgi:excisionase family DNA binding protein
MPPNSTIILHPQPRRDDEPIAFGLPEAARLLSLSVPFLRRELARGKLKPLRFGRRVLIKKDELDRYVRSGEQAAAVAGLE